MPTSGDADAPRPGSWKWRPPPSGRPFWENVLGEMVGELALYAIIGVGVLIVLGVVWLVRRAF